MVYPRSRVLNLTCLCFYLLIISHDIRSVKSKKDEQMLVATTREYRVQYTVQLTTVQEPQLRAAKQCVISRASKKKYQAKDL